MAELSARTPTENSLSRAGDCDAVTALFSTIDDALASGETDRFAGFDTFSMNLWPARQDQSPLVRARASLIDASMAPSIQVGGPLGEAINIPADSHPLPIVRAVHGRCGPLRFVNR